MEFATSPYISALDVAPTWRRPGCSNGGSLSPSRDPDTNEFSLAQRDSAFFCLFSNDHCNHAYFHGAHQLRDLFIRSARATGYGRRGQGLSWD